MIGNIAREVPTNLVRGNDVVWDDLRFPVTNIRITGTNPASWETFNGFQVLGFEYQAVNDEQVYFIAQLPHGYKHGSNIRFHVHWTPQTDDSATVRWGFEYIWANKDDSLSGSSTTVYKDVAINGNAGDHLITDIIEIDGTDKTLSSMLLCRLFRNSSHGNDDFDDIAYLLEADFHYQSDQVGSRQEYIK